ncbi:MAG: hypothetical protein K2Q06_08555, partial [Parvularculaceae bacterium]|nr:hypothetical protein [Parvularculaceae bacterium]
MMLNSQFASIVVAGLCRALVFGVVASTASCAQPPQYEWSRLVDEAPFPKSYNYPVHVAKDGRFVLLLREGNWESRDGAAWTRSSLPALQLNSAYQAYVNHAGATYALGTLNGNYTRFSIAPTIMRTDDHRSWTSLGASKSLLHVVFYASASFAGALWIIGGYDGSKESAEVWRSVDGVEWE